MRFGGRHAQTQRCIIQRTRTDPADALLNRVQYGEEQMTLRMQGQAVGSNVAICGHLPRRAARFRFKLFQYCLYGSLLFRARFRRSQVQVHSILHALLDTNRRSLEFRRPGFRVHRVNREIVR